MSNVKCQMSNVSRGLALIEILVVIVILGLLLAISVPLGINFLKTTQLDTATDEVIQTLRRAEALAISQENDSAYGVCFTSDSYYLIKGDNCPGETIQNFYLPGDVSASGLAEVIFSKLSGYPNTTGYIILTNAAGIDVIDLNEIGRLALVGPCQGNTTACSGFDELSCPGQDGCSWVLAHCEGVCDPCSTFLSKGLCDKQEGCLWDNQSKQCLDNPGCVSCDNFLDAVSCGAVDGPQYGCFWGTDECSGTAVSCGSYEDQSSCGGQDGCTWIIP